MSTVILTPANDQSIVLTCGSLASIPAPPPIVWNGIQYLKDLGTRDEALQNILDVLEEHDIPLDCNHVGWEEGTSRKMWLHLTGKMYAKRRLFALRMVLQKTHALRSINVKILQGLHGQIIDVVIEGDLEGDLDNEEILKHTQQNPPFLIFPPTAGSGSKQYRLRYIVDASTDVAAEDGPDIVAAGDAPTIVAAGDAPTIVAAGDAPTIVAAGDAPTIVAAGDAPTIVAAADAPTIVDAAIVAAADAPTVVNAAIVAVLREQLAHFKIIEVTAAVGDLFAQGAFEVSKQQTRRRGISTEALDRGCPSEGLQSTTAGLRTNFTAASFNEVAKKGAKAKGAKGAGEQKTGDQGAKAKEEAKAKVAKGAGKEKTGDQGAKAKANEMEGVKEGAKAKGNVEGAKAKADEMEHAKEGPKAKGDTEGAKAKADEVEGVKGVQANLETVSQSSKKRERELSQDMALKVASPAVKRKIWSGL